MGDKVRVLVTGSRRRGSKSDYDAISGALNEVSQEYGVPPEGFTVVHGGNPRGVDSLAGYVAEEAGATVEVHPADWKLEGRAAGVIRNQRMVNLGADLCLAFPLGGENGSYSDSRGTWDCVKRARSAGIPVRIY